MFETPINVLITNLLFLLRKSQETVARILIDLAIFWKVARSTLLVVFGLSEEVNGLGLSATQSYFRFV